jgi:hypothetical protein
MRVLGLLCIFSLPFQVFCWGFYGHKQINQLAVFTLPSELMGFYKAHILFITDHAVDPDMRRYVLKEEAPRHYIDIDHYGDDPFNDVPRKWFDAVDQYCEDTLMAYGIVPWHVYHVYRQLVVAFSEQKWDYALKLSADLGHYIADAHVPLHTTKNYNGQLTNQHGIHGFWESRLPELYAGDYDFLVGRAAYIPEPLESIWVAIEASHAAVDSVLEIEKNLTLAFKPDEKYAFEQRGIQTVKTYSEAFSNAYHTALNGMVERRMRAAIYSVGSFWYSAWLEAGKPDWKSVSKVDLQYLEEEHSNLKKTFHLGAIKGRAHEH